MRPTLHGARLGAHRARLHVQPVGKEWILLERSARLRVVTFVISALRTLPSIGFAADSVPSQPVTVNAGTSTYDYHPSTSTTDTGTSWYAWHAYSDGRDRIVARSVERGGHLGELHTVSDTGAVHGPPTIVAQNDRSAFVIWSTETRERWHVVCRNLTDEPAKDIRNLSDGKYDAIHPTAVVLSDGNLVAVWSAHVDGHWRIRGCRLQGQQAGEIFPVSSVDADAFRPVLTLHEDQVWAVWDQYQQPNYSVHGRVVFPELSGIERISPRGGYCLTPTALSHQRKMHVAWLSKSDVVGGPGVISQWHTLHVASRDKDGWRQIVTPNGNTTAAELTQGLMAKIAPEPIATGGYLGARLRPSLLSHGESLWLLWERKSDHRGSTPHVSGDLVGRQSLDGLWQSPVILKQGQVDYHLIDPPSSVAGRVRILASPLPRRGIRNYEAYEVDLADSQPFEQDVWLGWNPVSLPMENETRPRYTTSAGGKTYKLFWADLHCHNGLTADAEGQPDEMHFYARDRANLDVVVFTNNDFYNVPLSQHDYELGNLFAKTFSNDAKPGGSDFLSLPGFEWTSRIPGVATAVLSDPGNWLPPYRNRSYPNHRSVIYPPSGGPLVHFNEVANDISYLNSAVQRAGGITLSQHNAFKLTGHAVEVGLELTSGWSNYIGSHPHLFHEPLNRGVRLGFTANGDTHRRAPGLSGALTGIYATELTAEAVLDALRNRRCFATMGSRLFLDTRVDDAIMGGTATTSKRQATLALRTIGMQPIRNVSLIRNGKTIHEVTGDGAHRLEVEFIDKELPKGTHWYYWRVSQAGTGRVLPGNLMPARGHLAWSSPSWLVVE